MGKGRWPGIQWQGGTGTHISLNANQTRDAEITELSRVVANSPLACRLKLVGLLRSLVPAAPGPAGAMIS